MKVRSRSLSLLTPLAFVVAVAASSSCLLTSNFDGLTGNDTTSSSGTGGAAASGGAGGTSEATGGTPNGGSASSSTSGTGGGAGGMGGCTQKNIGGAFPASCVLDDFNRANGAPGLHWLIENDGDYEISNDQLVTPAPTMMGQSVHPGSILWSDVMAPTQEVFVTLSSFSTADFELELLLKAQAGPMECGTLQVSYHQGTLDASLCEVGGSFMELSPGGVMVTFNPGDQLGARATADGKLYGYKNGQLVATWDATPFSAYDKSGRVGFEGDGLQDAIAIDDFGGGGQ